MPAPHLVNVGFFSEFPANLEEIKAIVAEGAVGFKLFMAEQVGGLNIDDDEALKEALYAEAGKLMFQLPFTPKTTPC